MPKTNSLFPIKKLFKRLLRTDCSVGLTSNVNLTEPSLSVLIDESMASKLPISIEFMRPFPTGKKVVVHRTYFNASALCHYCQTIKA